MVLISAMQMHSLKHTPYQTIPTDKLFTPSKDYGKLLRVVGCSRAPSTDLHFCAQIMSRTRDHDAYSVPIKPFAL